MTTYTFIAKIGADTDDWTDGTGWNIAWRNTSGDVAIWSSTGSGFTSKDIGVVSPDWHIVG